jgi:hypothetical protein
MKAISVMNAIRLALRRASQMRSVNAGLEKLVRGCTNMGLGAGKRQRSACCCRSVMKQ